MYLSSWNANGRLVKSRLSTVIFLSLPPVSRQARSSASSADWLNSEAMTSDFCARRKANGPIPEYKSTTLLQDFKCFVTRSAMSCSASLLACTNASGAGATFAMPAFIIGRSFSSTVSPSTDRRIK